MDEVIYLDKNDAILFEQLISEGLTKEQAIEQMNLMGIGIKIEFTPIYGHTPIRPDMVIYDELKEEIAPKKSFPWYHGKRRY